MPLFGTRRQPWHTAHYHRTRLALFAVYALYFAQTPESGHFAAITAGLCVWEFAALATMEPAALPRPRLDGSADSVAEWNTLVRSAAALAIGFLVTLILIAMRLDAAVAINWHSDAPPPPSQWGMDAATLYPDWRYVMPFVVLINIAGGCAASWYKDAFALRSDDALAAATPRIPKD